MVLENLVKGVKYVAGGLALGASMLFGGAVISGCGEVEHEITELTNFNAEAGDREVQLSWRNPTTVDMPGVMIRRDINEYPVDENDGTLVYEGNDEAFTDTGLDHSVNYCYKAFSFSYTDPMLIRTIREASAIPYDATAPGEINNLNTIARSTEVELSWTNPTDFDFVQLRVVRKQNAFPADENDGTIVYEGTGTSVVDTGLTEGQVYTYSIFTYDDTPNRSAGTKFFRKADGVMALGWIGGGSDGWKTANGASAGNDPRSFNSPNDVFVHNGYIYVADTGNHRVCRIDSNGNFQGWIGGELSGWRFDNGASPGNDIYSFNSPVAVFVADAIYVVDRDNSRICKWSFSGNSLGWIGGADNGWHYLVGGAATDEVSGFDHPQGMCIANGEIYVADTGNSRVCKWNADGTVVGWIGLREWDSDRSTGGWKTEKFDFYKDNYELASQNLYSPIDVFFSSSLYVLDDRGLSEYYTIFGDDEFITWNNFGKSSGASIAYSIFVHFTKNNYFAKKQFANIEGYQYTQMYYPFLGGGYDGWKTGPEPSAGSGFQSLNSPAGIFVTYIGTESDTLYIADKGNHRISKWQD